MPSDVIQNKYQPPAFNQLGEKYLIKQEIGRSQAASLYQAIELASGRPVALKVFRRKFSADPRFALNFRNHMRKVFKLENEYLVSTWDYGMADGVYYIASEWVGGQDLGAYLAKAGLLSELQAIAIASQVCQALDVIHRHGLLHQNLKPENILLTQNGKIKLSDVGLSGLISESGLSRTHVMQGRYHYIAPEQVGGQEPAPESDLYSLGVILYEMLAGHCPFDARDIWDVLRMHVEAEPVPLDQNLHKASGALAKIVQQALQKSPEMRFQSAGAMNAAFTSVLMGSVPTQIDRASSSTNGVWNSVHQIGKRSKNFLQRPAPFRILGKLVPFGWVLFVQFAVSFLLAFMLLNTVITISSQVQKNRDLILETNVPPDGVNLPRKTMHKTNLLKEITAP